MRRDPTFERVKRMKSLNITILLTLVFISTNCPSTTIDDSLKGKATGKIKGVIFDGPGEPPITKEMVENILPSNAKWVAVIPEAFTYRNTLKLKSFLRTGQWYGETIEGSFKVVRFAKELGFKVMLKPHMGIIWDLSGWDEPKNIDFKIDADRKKYSDQRKKYISTLDNKTKGSWRGDFEVKNPDDWIVWEKQYEKFILDFAHLADSVQIDLFCIGTELDKVAIQRPNFWRSLIKKIKSVYKGQLTYCANWDNYKDIRFWDGLDYIGISAYFPISDKKSPSYKDALTGWKPHATELENFQKKYRKPVLFAELGYKSTEYAGSKPWLDYTDNKVDYNAQANLYQAAFNTFWQKEWFKGIFIWKWYYAGNGGPNSFSPQNKPAIDIISSWYEKY